MFKIFELNEDFLIQEEKDPLAFDDLSLAAGLGITLRTLWWANKCTNRLYSPLYLAKSGKQVSKEYPTTVLASIVNAPEIFKITDKDGNSCFSATKDLSKRHSAPYKVHTCEKVQWDKDVFEDNYRLIMRPDSRLDYIQERILEYLDMENFKWPNYVAAYVKGRSLISHVLPHMIKEGDSVDNLFTKVKDLLENNKNTELQSLFEDEVALPKTWVRIDLSDFFGHCRKAQVREALLANFNLSKISANILATILTTDMKFTNKKGEERIKRVLPQGTCTSPAISNLVALNTFDPDIKEYCEKNGLVYTRFSDDLVFSRKDKKEIWPKSEAEKRGVTGFTKEQLLEDVVNMVNKHGFWVNMKKTLNMHEGKKVRVCGFIVNEFLNLDRRWTKKTLSMVFNTLNNGWEKERQSFELKTGTTVSLEKFKQKVYGRLNRLVEHRPSVFLNWLMAQGGRVRALPLSPLVREKYQFTFAEKWNKRFNKFTISDFCRRISGFSGPGRSKLQEDIFKESQQEQDLILQEVRDLEFALNIRRLI